MSFVLQKNNKGGKAMDWFWKSIVATVLLIIIPFLTSVMKVKAQVEPEVTLFWWMMSVGIGVGLCFLRDRQYFLLLQFW